MPSRKPQPTVFSDSNDLGLERSMKKAGARTSRPRSVTTSEKALAGPYGARPATEPGRRAGFLPQFCSTSGSFLTHF